QRVGVRRAQRRVRVRRAVERKHRRPHVLVRPGPAHRHRHPVHQLPVRQQRRRLWLRLGRRIVGRLAVRLWQQHRPGPLVPVLRQRGPAVERLHLQPEPPDSPPAVAPAAL
ncbi:hypothetical protein H4R21_005777, partial [Coemansia helicoidea]